MPIKHPCLKKQHYVCNSSNIALLSFVVVFFCLNRILICSNNGDKWDLGHNFSLGVQLQRTKSQFVTWMMLKSTVNLKAFKAASGTQKVRIPSSLLANSSFSGWSICSQIPNSTLLASARYSPTSHAGIEIFDTLFASPKRVFSFKAVTGSENYLSCAILKKF
mgnify:FL=1